MNLRRFLWIALFLPLTAGDVSDALQDVVQQVSSEQAKPFGSLVTDIGRIFLNRPYVAASLEGHETEQLVVRLDGFDCFTFMETSLALARMLRQDTGDLDAFKKELTALRYRDGIIAGYPSRLHYTSDWIFDNAQRGHVRDITQEIGGKPYTKAIDYMTTHRESYRHLASDQHFADMQQVEAELNRRTRYYLPKAHIQEVEDKIQEGDVIALTTTILGLDIVHVGLAVKVADRVHLLHASSVRKQVEITRLPLHAYMASMKSRHGIMVFRPISP